MAKVLIACEYSGIVREAFAARGHDAWSCDLLPTEIPGNHFQDSIWHVLSNPLTMWWDLIIAHPPCTYLCNSGVRWLHSEPGRWDKMKEGAYFFKALLNAHCDKIAVENPVIHKYAKEIIGQEFTQSIQPWQFGHKEMKRTCLWLKGLPPLQPTNVVGPPPKDAKEKAKWAIVHRASPGPDRWKDRSRTLSGIAEAMASQWG